LLRDSVGNEKIPFYQSQLPVPIAHSILFHFFQSSHASPKNKNIVFFHPFGIVRRRPVEIGSENKKKNKKKTHTHKSFNQLFIRSLGKVQPLFCRTIFRFLKWQADRVCSLNCWSVT
jgi:hypothetical protein